ncbi:hypothetical protein BSKO_03887 [Bryopsis sp. KO-2023]|nr:hypothetical protein BSKO_03887 [Bryopsis sp. KO-2023]
MSGQELDTLLQEEKAYSSKLAKKVQEQAGELKRQADELDWAAECRQECTERLLELDPGFFGKLEKQLKDAQRKSAEANKQNRELRKLLDRHRKDYGAARLRTDRLTEQLAAEVEARKAAESHARRLEITFERSGKGVALMKAAKSGSELEIALKKIETLQTKLHEKDDVVLAIEDAPKTSSDSPAPTTQQSPHSATLQSRIYELEAELEEYRQAGCSQNLELESEEVKRLKERVTTFNEHEEAMLATCEKLKTKIEEEVQDKAALLDYVQEMQDERDALLKGRGVNTRTTNRNHEDAQNNLGQYKARLSTLESREALVQDELLSLQKSEAEAQLEMAEAYEEIQHLGNQRLDLEKELQDAQAQNEALQKNWEEKQQLLSRIQSDLVETDKRLIESEQEVRRLRDVSDTNMELKTRETTLLELVDDLRTKIEQLKRSIREKDMCFGQFVELQERVVRFIEAPDDIDSLAKLEPLQAIEGSTVWIEKVKTAIKRGNEAEKQLAIKDSQRHEVASSLEEMAVQHRALQSRHEEALKSREALLNQVDQLMEDTDEMQCIGFRNEALMEELTREKQMNANLTDVNTKLKGQYEELLAEVDELRTQQTNGDDVLHHTKEERDALSEKVGTLRDRVKELEVKYREASESTRRLRRLGDIESRAEQFEKSSKEARAERDRLAERVEEYSRNMQSLQAGLKETQGSKQDLVAELDRVQIAMESLKGERAELTSQVERDVSLRLKLGRLLSRVPSDGQQKETVDEDPIVTTVRTLVVNQSLEVIRGGSLLGASTRRLQAEKDCAANDASATRKQATDTCDSTASRGQRSGAPSREASPERRRGLGGDVSHLQSVIHQKNQKISGLRELVRKICDIPEECTPILRDDCETSESCELAASTCDDPGLTSKSTKVLVKLLAVDEEEYTKRRAVSDSEAPQPIRDTKKESLQKQLKDLHSSFRGMRDKYKDAQKPEQ